jgi:hypothetical protein
MKNSVAYFSMHTPRFPRHIHAIGFDKAQSVEGSASASLANLEAEHIFPHLNIAFTSAWQYRGDEILNGRTYHRFDNPKDDRKVWIQLGLHAALKG